LPGIEQISTELIQARDSTLNSENHIHSIWNKEELTEQWKESIIMPIYKKGSKTDSSNYRETTLLSSTYKILSSILLSRLTPYINKITKDHQCGF
jgi:hypothetical protein